jgi:hypothetical protein
VDSVSFLVIPAKILIKFYLISIVFKDAPEVAILSLPRVVNMVKSEIEYFMIASLCE